MAHMKLIFHIFNVTMIAMAFAAAIPLKPTSHPVQILEITLAEKTLTLKNWENTTIMIA